MRSEVAGKQETKLWVAYRDSQYERPADGYDLLRAAVIKKAVSDYARALRRHRKFPYDRQAGNAMRECETFFRGDMSLYVDMDGESVIEAIQEKVSKEKPRKYKKKKGRGRPKKR